MTQTEHTIINMDMVICHWTDEPNLLKDSVSSDSMAVYKCCYYYYYYYTPHSVAFTCSIIQLIKLTSCTFCIIFQAYVLHLHCHYSSALILNITNPISLFHFPPKCLEHFGC